MAENWIGADLRAMAENLRASIKQFGGFSPEQVRQAGVMGEEALKLKVLLALTNGDKTGHEILEWIKNESGSKLRPTSGSLYPLLENLLDVGLVEASFKKDRKTYSLTKAGKEAAETLKVEPEIEQEGWDSPSWIDLRGDLPRAGKRLARVSIEVAGRGTKEQQARAVEILDEATRALHEILAEK